MIYNKKIIRLHKSIYSSNIPDQSKQHYNYIPDQRKVGEPSLLL